MAYFKINARFRSQNLIFGVHCNEDNLNETVAEMVRFKQKDSSIAPAEISYGKQKIDKTEFDNLPKEKTSTIEKVEIN